MLLSFIKTAVGFPIAIPLPRNCTQFLGVYRACNCAQVKFSCVGNPKQQLYISHSIRSSSLILRFISSANFYSPDIYSILKPELVFCKSRDLSPSYADLRIYLFPLRCPTFILKFNSTHNTLEINIS